MLSPTLNTKLIPPRKRSALIEREQLTEKLVRVRDHRLLLICAPAGYGKTSVLIQAHAQLRRESLSVGWISLDDGDKDLSRFILYLIDAVRRSGLKFGHALTTLLGTGASLPMDTLKTLILNELAALDQEVYLILDDYHLVSDAEIRDLVNAILLSPVQQLRLLISSRTLNELPVSRLRALGQIQEVEVADLTFSEREVSDFVSKVRGAPLSAAQVARLRDETEGWAASLQMAGIALRGVDEVDGFLDRFSGEHKSVGDFLGEEVLQRQPPELQEFMTLTSILPRFNWSLCNAVTGESDARAMIDELERRNLFIFSLDLEHHWYRYHHLFSDFLRRRLKERHPDRVTQCHRLASDWLAEHRFMTDAIEHAFAAQDIAQAGELLDRACSDLFAAGRTATLMSLSSRLPPEILDRLPRLQLERAWHNELSWNFHDARAELDRVRAVLDERRQTCNNAPADADLVFLEAKFAHREMMLCLLSDDMPAAGRLARRWLQEGKTPDPFMCASAGSATMASQREMFSCEGVATSTRMLYDRFVEGGARYGVVFHQSIAGSTFAVRGDLDRAQEALEIALQTAVELHGERSALYNMPALLLADVYYERNQLRLVEEILAQRDITANLGFVDNLVAGFLTSARLMAMRGRYEEADTLLEEGEWLAAQRGFPRMHASLFHERLRMLQALGRSRELVTLARTSSLCTRLDAPPTPAEGVVGTDLLLAMSAARLMLAENSAREGATLLKPWYAYTRQRHCHRPAIACGVLLARTMAAAGERRGAQRVLHECLQMGEFGRFVRTFVDEGAEVQALLADLRGLDGATGHSQTAEYLTTILHAGADPDRYAPPPAGEMPPSGHELMSQRELQILSLAAQGNQNQDIAAALFLAESTVKWYWQRIFDKLDVRRRPDAIRRARQLHWIA